MPCSATRALPVRPRLRPATLSCRCDQLPLLEPPPRTPEPAARTPSRCPDARPSSSCVPDVVRHPGAVRGTVAVPPLTRLAEVAGAAVVVVVLPAAGADEDRDRSRRRRSRCRCGGRGDAVGVVDDDAVSSSTHWAWTSSSGCATAYPTAISATTPTVTPAPIRIRLRFVRGPLAPRPRAWPLASCSRRAACSRARRSARVGSRGRGASRPGTASGRGAGVVRSVAGRLVAPTSFSAIRPLAPVPTAFGSPRAEPYRPTLGPANA